MNHYEALEVARNASPAVVRAAYKSLMQRYHPDRNPGDAATARHAAAIVEAFQVLSDPDRRAAYDRALDAPVGHPLRREAVEARTAGRRKPPARHPLWLQAAVTAGAVALAWLAWPSVRPTAPAAGVAVTGAPPPAEAAPAAGRASGPTVADYVRDLNVALAPSAEPAAPRHTLSIKSLGVVVGAFDSERFTAFLERHRDYIVRALTERLAAADPERLLRDDGERYLRRLVVDALAEITHTGPFENSALPTGATAARYGAVDVILPDAYAVETRQGERVTVRSFAPR